MKRIAGFGVIYGIILFIAFTYRDSIIIWLHEENQHQLLWMFLVSLFIHTIPIIPVTIFSGLMGIKYGVWLGAFINWVGSIGAATLFFFLARHYFVAFFQKSISKNKKAKRMEELISQNAFITVLFSRMIPIIPAQAVHLSSGLSSMLFVSYFVATAIGQIPTMFMYAYLGKQLYLSFSGFLTAIIIYIGLVLLMLLFSLYQIKYKKA